MRHTSTKKLFTKPTLKLLSFNIQAGAQTRSYRDYFTKILHPFIFGAHSHHLDHVGELIHDFDIVALQEVDGGSLRSNYINQLRYLADRGSFEFHHQQLNRNWGHFGQFSNALLSRLVPFKTENHTLPGLKGRGAMLAFYGRPENPLLVVNIHLALGEKTRNQQLAYLAEQINRYQHVIIMGDLNCKPEALLSSPLNNGILTFSDDYFPTYPSWDPKHPIDHILVSSSIHIKNVQILSAELSDHKPISAEIILPDELMQ